MTAASELLGATFGQFDAILPPRAGMGLREHDRAWIG